MSDVEAAGYRMPAEWERHEATWIAWPTNRDDWPGKFEAIPWVYGEIVRHLHRAEPVRILIDSEPAAEAVHAILDKIDLDWSRIELVPVPTDRVWTRDFAPIFV